MKGIAAQIDRTREGLQMVIDGLNNAPQKLLFVAKRRKLAPKFCQSRERVVFSPVKCGLD